MDLDAKGLFEGMKRSLGSDFFEELNKELDEACAKSDADMRQRDIALDKFIAEGEPRTPALRYGVRGYDKTSVMRTEGGGIQAELCAGISSEIGRLWHSIYLFER